MRSSNLLLLGLAACLTVAAANGAAAADGARLSEACSSCHGQEGRGGGAIPALAGQDETTLRQRMQALAAGDPSATIMVRILGGYDDDEIAALAAWFARVSR